MDLLKKKISNHIHKKQGYPKCSFENSSKIQRNTKETFINKAISIHCNKYDYSLVEYINTNTKVKILCKIHGEFEQLPINHYKQNYPNCCKNAKITNDKFIERSKKIHGDKYDYSNVEYIHISKPVKIICKVHGEFEQTPR